METVAAYPRSRWLVMFTVFFGYVSLGMMLVAFSPIVGIVSKEFNITPGQMSFYALGVYTLVNAVSIIVSGVLFDRFGVKPILFAGSAIVLVGALLTPVLTHSIAGIVVLRVIIGLGEGPVAGCIATVAARWFPLKERGLYSGVVGAGICIGIAASFIIQGAMLEATNGDWRVAVMTLLIGPAIAMIMVIIMMFAAKESALPHLSDLSFADKTTRDFSRIVKSSAFYVIIAVMVCYTWVLNAFTDLTPGYIAIAPPMGLGRGPAAAGQFMSITQLGEIFGAICSGLIVDRIFKGNAKPVIIAAFLVQAFAMLSVKFPFAYDNSVLFSILLFLVGFSIMCVITPLTTFIATNMPVSVVAKVFSIAFGIGLVTGGIGVSVGSGILHVTSSYQGPILLVSIVALVGFGFALFLSRPKGVTGSAPEAAPELTV